MQYPTRAQAEEYLRQAESLNPGPWVQHSIHVARAAEAIARAHPQLDPERAYICGLLHDIGRREGVTDMRHVVDGYRFLATEGFEGAARICLTHSFSIPDVEAASGAWDCPRRDIEFVAGVLAANPFDVYDRLIQLCDAIALPAGFCLMEKRLVDVAIRRGVNDQTPAKWQAFLDLQRRFESEIGRSIYSLLPGVVENTFGTALEARS